MKAVLFDLDGTLLDTLEDLANAANYALEALGYPRRSLEEIRTFVGNGAVSLLTQSLPADRKDDIDKILPIFREYYGAHSQDLTRPYDGVLALLDRLAAEGYGLAVVSNKPDYAVQLLAKEYFPAIPFAVGEREGIRRKPCADSIYEAIRALGADREHCVYVGDSEVDVQTAANAGIPCIAVTWGFRDRDILTASGATHFADTADALYDKICELI